ncbi:MAG: YbgC/FadM family acyl-CoA thioesterase [Chitinivibrionales bacterium]|nr:YbgC/FadM family acyl-CoA thioesterase [Chitinivibrionales bacterium]
MTVKIRVYYEDTDCGNVVYYANYLKYMERSRTELLRERGIELAHFHQKGYLFAVVEAHVKYRAPARYNDLLDVDSTVIDMSSVSLTFKTIIKNQNGDVLTTGRIKLACLNRDGKATRIPDEIAEQFMTAC